MSTCSRTLQNQSGAVRPIRRPSANCGQRHEFGGFRESRHSHLVSSTLDKPIKHTLQSTRGLQPAGNIYMSAVRPFRCFDSRVIVAALGVAAWLIASAWLSRILAPAPMPRLALALSQAGAFAALVLVIRRSISRLDELAQHIHYQALAVTAAIMVTAIAGWAFLERAGLPHIDWSLYAAPAFTLTWAVGVIWIARRYE
jgi:hypothetical protein